MSKIRLGNLSRWSKFVGFAVGLMAGGLAQAQVQVVSGNGISPVWQSLYGAQGVDPDADPDHDGLSNRDEAIAGTDPFSAASAPRMSMFVITNKSAQVRIMGALGKHYELQGSEAICGNGASNTWFTEASLVARTNPTVTLTAPASLPMKFFRVRISDVDTDGDGLTDWEEYQLGLDPLNAFSNGQKDANGKPLSDYAYAMRQLNFQPRTYGMGDTVAKPDLLIYAKDFSAGTGLTGEYYTNSSRIYTNVANFNPTNLFLVTNDAAIDFRWGPALNPNLSNKFCTVRWTGQVRPQFTEAYVFETRTDDGVKLWVNDQLLIDSWQYLGTTTWTNTINLTADVRYNIRMEYFNYGANARAQLFWHSDSQPRQIIPTASLYPSAGGYAPSTVTTPLNAIAFLGQPFSYAIQAANTPLGYVVTNLPSGLGFDSTNNVISGIPNVAGTFVISINVSNIIGVGTSELNLRVIDTGSAVSREVWSGVAGTSITNIPVHSPASTSNTLATLEGITSFGDNYGERVRGYLTAPVTGNYYFWISANNSAELWISNDEEPVNKVRRAFITKGTTTPRTWNLQPSQRSPWLALKAGQRYYIEILHKAGTGLGDHWSVGWLQDPSGTNTSPASIVPGYVLSPFTEPSGAAIPGTLYSANMLAQPGIISSGVGSATLRLSPDETQAILKFSYSGMSTPVTAKHIHADTYKAKNLQGQIVFDIDAATPQADGSYIWTIVPSGPLTAADLVEIVKEGKSYLNVHTINYPAGEISGHFTLANGSSTFTPPPAPPAWTDDHAANSNSVARFLQQATFGPSIADLKAVKMSGYSAWLTKQFALPVTSHLPVVLASAKADPNASLSGILTFNTWWKQSVTAPDQLRQRVAFALSEIMVVSEQGTLADNPLALSSYYDLLLKDAFGNFRTLLKDVTLHPAMGLYLNMLRNDKANSVLGTRPNENYAREIMQLFSVGLNRMWPDGTLILNSQGEIVPTYDQHVIEGYARVFTGWNYYQTNLTKGRLPTNWNPPPDYINPMVLVSQHHELGAKNLLDNAVLPPAAGPQTDQNTTNFDAYCSQDLDKALDSLFYNENLGPFICRQLIQRLVTSNPSRDYLYRVVEVFNDNGKGVRGDMKAVITAILLDYEARSATLLGEPTFGKQREPVLRATAVARAFMTPPALSGSFSQKGSRAITITTSKPHRLGPSDDVFLSFSGTKVPASQIYYNVAVTGPNTFTINADGLSLGTYGQSGNVLTVTNSGHGLAAGNQIYLTATSGGAHSGIYTVQTVPSSSVFTLTAADSMTRSGACVFPKWDGSTLDQTGTNITVTTSAPHCLAVGNNVYVAFPMGSSSSNGAYKVASLSGPFQFNIRTSISDQGFSYDALVLPLAAAPITRSGKVTVGYSTWDMEYTDSGSSLSLFQTPLHSPTVFNFFFPDYKFPGVLSSSGLTTPEFQLTSDTSVVLQMNFFSTSMFNNGNNTNGLSSFTGGNGSIALDLGPWMTPTYTADSGIPALVDSLASLLCAGQVLPATKQIIVSYVANPRFPYTTPTANQMRDRVRAVAHLLVTSSEFAIQR